MRYEKGFTYKTDFRELRIMVVVEGYVMARYKGCPPFVKDKNRFDALLKTQNAEPINHQP